jgi:hypothetical protein
VNYNSILSNFLSINPKTKKEKDASRKSKKRKDTSIKRGRNLACASGDKSFNE